MTSLRAWTSIAVGASIVATAALLSGGSSASALAPVFTATPHTSTAGGTETITAVDKCPAPAGAGDWVAIIKVAQGANPEVSFKNFLIAADGSWGGTMTLPALMPGAAQLTGACFDAFHHVADEVDYASVDLTITAPTTSSAASSPASSTTAPTSTPATSASSSGGGTLANTGFRYTVPLSALGLGALLVGFAMLFAGRRGRRGARAH